MKSYTYKDLPNVYVSGMQQSRDEYFDGVRNGSLRYFRIGIEHPQIKVYGDTAVLTYTALLTANAYGARGTFPMSGKHFYKKRNGGWIEVNG